MEDSPQPFSLFRTPDTSLIIFGIIVFAAILTWIIPPGSYQRDAIQVEGVGEREVVLPGSFEWEEVEEIGVAARIVHTVAIIFQAPILGLIDPDAAPIVAFVLLIGGAFAILTKTGAVDSSLRALVRRSESSTWLEYLLIPLFMVLFSLGGAVFGMSEETIPFVLIFVPLALALGYDSLTGAAIPFVGAAAGFAAAFLNPFTMGVAKGIAGVPMDAGIEFRVVLWFVTTAIAIAFVVWHAHRVKDQPKRSPVYTLDEKLRKEGLHLDEDLGAFTLQQKNVLAVFFLGIATLVFGVLQFGWYIIEIAALFVGMGVAMAVVGRLSGNDAAKAFMDGVRDLAPTALIIGLARGILIVMQDGQIIDPILNTLATGLEGVGSGMSAVAMFGLQSVINLMVPSGSGQAALTMPLMAPLADLVGVTRDTAVLAYQMGDGFTNMIIPTSAVLMGVLSLAHIPWTTWARWILPLQLVLFGLGIVVLFIAISLGF